MAAPSLFPPEEYSESEKEALNAFRAKCTDLNLTEEQQSDAHLVRWLRARNFDVDKALHMLKLSLEWRKENNVDGILEREKLPSDAQSTYVFANLGVDKNGYPILLVPVGRQDTRSLLEKYGADECFKFHIINCETMMELLRKLGKEQGRPVTKFVQIVDFEGYSIRQFTSKLCRDFLFRMQKSIDPNYPEMLHYAVIVNAPKIFYMIFSLLKPIIPKHTLEKVDIYGPEPEKWKKAIAERFPLELVPPHWGGTRKGSDEYCSQDDIWQYGPVPLSFFTGGGTLIPDEDDSTLTRITINPRDTFKVPLNITKENSSIAWSFRSDNHDIGFQIVYEDTEEVIVPFTRVQSQKHLQEGTQSCLQLGKYSFIFDNTFSLARSKTVYYNVSVIEPEILDYNGVQECNGNGNTAVE